jgi:putative membrane protein
MRGHGPPLGIATLAVMAISAYHPLMVGDWLLENLLVVLLLAGLAITYRRYPLSNTSYWMVFLFLCVHEWGAHHKYADVPLGEWLKTVLQTQRNHYDRVAHFAFGLFFAYPMQEIAYRWIGARDGWGYYLPFEASIAVGAVYEIFESIVASIVSPQAGEAFVGFQGDMWDAQKDIALAGVGAALTLGFVYCKRKLHHGDR